MSDVASVTIPADTSNQPPNAPTGLATTSTACNRIDLKWQDNSNDETGFILKSRDLDIPNSPDRCTFLAAGTTSYSDTQVAAGNSMHYQIAAYKGSGNDCLCSAWSAPVEVEVPACSQPPSVITLTATALSDTIIHLTWNDLSNEQSYAVYQEIPGANGQSSQWETVATNGPIDTSNGSLYLDVVYLAASTSYRFRVDAVLKNGQTATSNTASAVTWISPELKSMLIGSGTSATYFQEEPFSQCQHQILFNEHGYFERYVRSTAPGTPSTWQLAETGWITSVTPGMLTYFQLNEHKTSFYTYWGYMKVEGIGCQGGDVDLYKQ